MTIYQVNNVTITQSYPYTVDSSMDTDMVDLIQQTQELLQDYIKSGTTTITDVAMILIEHENGEKSTQSIACTDTHGKYVLPNNLSVIFESPVKNPDDTDTPQ